MHYIQVPKAGFGKRGKMFKKKFLFILCFLGFLIFIALIPMFTKSDEVFNFVLQKKYSFQSTDDKVTILLLGNAGGMHEGASLTDTIMVASYNIKSDRVYLISLPRDLWVDKIKAKLNAVYEIGDAKNQGLNFSKDTIGEILGVPIHYVLRIDFRGFVKAIDEVGRVDVDIERSFTDALYPITDKENDLCGWEETEKDFNEKEAKKLNIEVGKRKILIKDGNIATDSAEPDKGLQYFACRYEQISFNKGQTHMNGDMALKFVRSRMGNNSEGSDFARSKRQQKVIETFKAKVLSLETLVSPTKISGLLTTFGQTIETDISIKEAIELYSLVKKSTSHNFVLSNTGKNALLTTPPLQEYGGSWILIPKSGNFNEIKEFIKKVLNGEVTEYEASASARTGN